MVVGDKVRHKATGRVGVVVSIRDGRLLVLVANHGYMVYPVEDWEVAK
jgi:hypothetical protein